jgi:hypothetical protein
MTYNEWANGIRVFLPLADILEDNDGQLVIYTGLRLDGDNIALYDCTCVGGHALDGGECDNYTEDDDESS